MSQTIPEGYYSLAEVFNFLGQDVFKGTWTGQELEIAKANVLHKALPDFEQYLIKELEPTLSGIHYQSRYEDFLNLDAHKLWDTWYACAHHLTERFEAHIGRSMKTETPVHLSDFLAPNTPFTTAQDFIACTMRYVSNKKRLEHMLYSAHLQVQIKDIRTGDIRDIPFKCWLYNENPRSDTLQFDLFTSSGTYGHHNTYRFDIYKGPLIISQKAFTNFRDGYYPTYDGKNDSEMYTELIEEKPMENPMHEGSPYMVAARRCYKDLNVSLENQPSRRDVYEWIEKNEPKLLKGLGDKKRIFTIIREPEMKKGGPFTGNAKKRKKTKKRNLSPKVSRLTSKTT